MGLSRSRSRALWGGGIGGGGLQLPLYYQVGPAYWPAYKAKYLDGLSSTPALTTATRSAMGATLSGSTKWAVGVLGPDGKIYGVPLTATDILIIGTGTPGPLQALLSGWVNKF